MNIAVKDVSLLQSIQPQQVGNYLNIHGWIKQNEIVNKASIWTYTLEESAIQLVLPLQQDIPGFPVSMSLILETLEKIESRSQLEILSDLISTVKNIKIQGVVMQINTSFLDDFSGEIIILGFVIDNLGEKFTLNSKGMIIFLQLKPTKSVFL